ncbi:hypothetical protein LTSEJOH_3451 [Salmonella enterica subsp. enterica serovar Johannesburg str. S5-703]|nr:hypothetical protein LTSEJOH_3451 [Salmonella enterica subsp. enterica serovar Johannesburg str. S5-703]
MKKNPAPAGWKLKKNPAPGGVFLWNLVRGKDESHLPDKAFPPPSGKRLYFPPDVRRCN